jgi:glycosyltransferase involved in cell wall biosynthesis
MGRRDELRRFLDSVSAQTYPPLEVILVDQNPPGFLDDIVHEYSRALPLRAIRSEVAGLSISRNVGVSASSGDILLFPDDDCAYTDNYIKDIFFAFISSNADVLHANYYDPELDKFHFPGIAQDAVHMTFDQALTFGSSICLAVRRDVFFHMDGFDVRMGLGSTAICHVSEDVEFLCRSLAMGRKILLFPNIFCLHPKAERSASSPAFWKRNGSSLAAHVYICLLYGKKENILFAVGHSVSGMLYNFLRLNKKNSKIYLGRIFGAVEQLPRLLSTPRSGISK